MRRYAKDNLGTVSITRTEASFTEMTVSGITTTFVNAVSTVAISVGRYCSRSTAVRPRVDRAWSQQLKLDHGEPVSSFAFNFTVRPCIMGAGVAANTEVKYAEAAAAAKEWRRATVFAIDEARVAAQTVKVEHEDGVTAADQAVTALVTVQAGRCRLTLSNPVLKAPLVSVLEATI